MKDDVFGRSSAVSVEHKPVGVCAEPKQVFGIIIDEASNRERHEEARAAARGSGIGFLTLEVSEPRS